MRKLLPSPICCLLLVQQLLAQGVPTRLNLVVVRGEGAINHTNRRAAEDPEVRVEDENNRPIAGAGVVFTLPTSGPSGEFDKGSQTTTVVTDEKGLAAARGLKTNGVTGKMQIHVSASYRGQSARTSITEFNMAPEGTPKKGGSGKWIAIIAVVGGAAAGGLAATRKSGSSSSNTPGSPTNPTVITISPGSPTVGAPR